MHFVFVVALTLGCAAHAAMQCYLCASANSANKHLYVNVTGSTLYQISFTDYRQHDICFVYAVICKAVFNTEAEGHFCHAGQIRAAKR